MCCVGRKTNPNPAQTAQSADSVVDSGMFLVGTSLQKGGFRSFSSSIRQTLTQGLQLSLVAKTLTPTYLPFIRSCQCIFAHMNKSWFGKNLSSETLLMNPSIKILKNPPLSPLHLHGIVFMGIIMLCLPTVGNTVLRDGFVNWTVPSFPFFVCQLFLDLTAFRDD